MDKQTPTQIATQSMKGCGILMQGKCVNLFGNTPFECNCGNIIKETLLLCPSCKSKIFAYRTAWENELEKINNYRRLLPFEERMLYEMMTRDLIELTSALKILNTKEAEK